MTMRQARRDASQADPACTTQSGAIMLTTSDTTPSATTMPAGIAGSVRSNTEQALARPPRPTDFTPDDVLTAHRGGKLSVSLRAPLANRRDLSMLYTPGVAGVSSLIATDPAAARDYTWASRVVAVISDGTAVLGLGDIGPKASLPVMEGKSALMKAFAGLDSVPIVLSTKDPDEIVAAVTAIAPSFGAINLEDISAPRCFEVERRLVDALDIPVMHDDQHGTAVVVLAALMNAASVIQRVMIDLRVVIAGAGAAGVACAKILLAAGIHDLVLVDSKGVLSVGRDGMHPVKAEMAALSNPRGITGSLADAMAGADVFIGVSGGRGARARGRSRSSSRWPTPPRRSTRPPPCETVQPSLRPGAATSRTRSTTCWPSPASSSVPSTAAPRRSPRG
jgi:malate dehydrogenase (oxaloacetate-decarboxylating)